MKTVIKDKELQETILEAIFLLCDTTGSTLGPTGTNVLISSSHLKPFITNDGVTIAESISSDDEKVRSVLEVIKEASLKTNLLVGDGTTTTLVLLESIYKNGLEEIKNGAYPIKIKNELQASIPFLMNLLDELKMPLTKTLASYIASTSCEDTILGTFLANIFAKMNSKWGIKVLEGNKDKTDYEIRKGYSILLETPNLFLKKDEEIILENAYVLIVSGTLYSLEQISDVLNEGICRDKTIIVLAGDVIEDVEKEVLGLYLQEQKKIFLIKVSDYGLRKEEIMEDLSVISQTTVHNLNYNDISFKDTGMVEKVILKKEEIILISNAPVAKYVRKLEKKLALLDSEYEKEFYEERIGKLKKGLCFIYAGGVTKQEVVERKMRIIDAVNALGVSSDGVVIGEGIAFLQIVDKIPLTNTGFKIIRDALEMPFKKIMENAMEDKEQKLKVIKEANYKKIYDLERKEYVAIEDSQVYDAVRVLKVALQNAISVASMLLSTNYLVIDSEPKKISTDEYM